MINKLKEEIKGMDMHNKKNPNNQIELVIDNFEGDRWFVWKNTGKRLSGVEEKVYVYDHVIYE